jgi:hypothetical protein
LFGHSHIILTILTLPIQISRVTTAVAVPTRQTWNLVLSPLSFNSTDFDYGFYNSSYGGNPDKVYAIGLCRGDLKPDVCRSFLSFSKDILPTQLCPDQKEAIALYDECMLRYSSRNIFSTMEDTPQFIWNNFFIVLDNRSKIKFHDQLSSLLQNLTDQAAAGGSLCKCAVGHAATPSFEAIYGLVQCTPDLAEQDCKYCLSGAFENFLDDNPWSIGARIVVRPSCNFRYEIFSFYDPTADPPPPLPPPPPGIYQLCCYA